MPVSSWDGAVNPTGNNEHDVVPPCKRPSNTEPGSMCPDVEPKSFCCFHFSPQRLHSRVGTVNDLYIFCLNSHCCFVCKHARLARKHNANTFFCSIFSQADRRVIALQQHACVTVWHVSWERTQCSCVAPCRPPTPPQYLNTQTHPPSRLWIVLFVLPQDPILIMFSLQAPFPRGCDLGLRGAWLWCLFFIR